MKATLQKKTTTNKLDLIMEEKNHFCFPSLVKYFGRPTSHGEGESSGRGLSRNTRDFQPRSRAPRSPARPYLCGCAEIYAAERSHPLPPASSPLQWPCFLAAQLLRTHHYNFFFFALDSERLIKRSVENFAVQWGAREKEGAAGDA